MATKQSKAALSKAAPKPGISGEIGARAAGEAGQIPITSMVSYDDAADVQIALLTITPGLTTTFTVSPGDFAKVVDSIRCSGFTGAWDALNGTSAVTKSGTDTLTMAVNSSGFGAAPAPASITAYATGAGSVTQRVRSNGAAGDIGKLVEGQRVTYTITGAVPVPELDGQSFPIEKLNTDNFAITAAVATDLTGATATIDFIEQPHSPNADVPITGYRDVWVHHYNVALANNQTGYVTATQADAQAMITAGDAIDAYDLTMAGPHISVDDPWPPVAAPPPSPSPSPPAPAPSPAPPPASPAPAPAPAPIDPAVR
jgi:hypothetical protein